MTSADLVIKNASEMLTISGDNAKPRTGRAMSELGLVGEGCVAVSAVAVGRGNDEFLMTNVEGMTKSE